MIRSASAWIAHCGGSNVACVWLMLAGVLTLPGCGNWLPEGSRVGSVTAPGVNRSLNGLGLHRKLWEQAGARCLTPTKLSPKLDSMDVIVLVGQSFEPPGRAARDWLENWLAAGDGRTVIYFGRDFNADIYFRQRTLPPPNSELRLRAEQLLAMRATEELNERLRQLPESTFCGWFFLEVNRRPTNYQNFSGPWARQVELGELRGSWPVGVALQPPSDRRLRTKKPSWIAQPDSGEEELKPMRVGDAGNEVVQQSNWEPRELRNSQQWEAELNRAPRSQIRLAAEDGQALVFRLTSQRFGNGQILIVANGAPLLNGSLVDPLHRAVGEQLVQACLPAQRVALLAFDQAGLSISSIEEKDARAAGLEMLTVWPLSGITMPAALLGIIVCAALLPILGRPQTPARRSVSDFGLHIEAMGRMLSEARDVEHATGTIADYFRKVRGEMPPLWLREFERSEGVKE